MWLKEERTSPNEHSFASKPLGMRVGAIDCIKNPELQRGFNVQVSAANLDRLAVLSH